jgi:hypothetical protein
VPKGSKEAVKVRRGVRIDLQVCSEAVLEVFKDIGCRVPSIGFLEGSPEPPRGGGIGMHLLDMRSEVQDHMALSNAIALVPVPLFFLYFFLLSFHYSIPIILVLREGRPEMNPLALLPQSL